MIISLTGSTGFLGAALTNKLAGSNHKVCHMVRTASDQPLDNTSVIGSISGETNFRAALANVEVVIHLAARVHMMKDNAADSLEEFRKLNTEGTENLARQAAEAGVKRFIYISSVVVNGSFSAKPLRYDDIVRPQESYAISKFEAEKELRKIAVETGMEVVIIRPPLIYGANAPGNFGSFFDLAKKNFPLPLGSINNKRSLVGIDNIVDLIVTCIDHPKAVNQTFLVSDDHDVSTSDLLRSLIIAAGKTPRLIPFPVSFLRFFAGLLRKTSMVDKMTSDFQVDISHTRDTLGWQPPVSFEEGIRRCFK